jgi:metal-responsive CopG/Arc/MetJ family transcriptional regulator
MGKLTFSITMAIETRQALDQKVAEGRFRGRSQAIEHFVKRGLELERKEHEFLDQREREWIAFGATNNRSVALLQELIDMIEEDPRVVKTLQEVIRGLQGR